MKLAHLCALGLAAALGPFFAATSAQAQATRTWVSGVGDDVNPCSRTAPCKTFAGAISKTAVGGEINCIDPGGYGAVTITKSITIDCGGTLGSILATGTSGVTVNAASVAVTLRNLTINGAGTGIHGIRFLQSGALRVENVKVFNFSQRGLDIAPNGNTELFVTDSEIYNNGTGSTIPAINVAPTGSASTITTINRTSVQNNSAGIAVTTASTTGLTAAIVRDSAISGNSGIGISAQAAAGGPALLMTVDKSGVVSNGTGISSDGSNSNVQLASTIVANNSTGLTIANTGKIVSFSSNVLSGNIAVNGSPSSTVPPQ